MFDISNGMESFSEGRSWCRVDNYRNMAYGTFQSNRKPDAGEFQPCSNLKN
jgi:hypothetical protein